jgi:hydroxymethylglutaryl-CoA lyase
LNALKTGAREIAIFIAAIETFCQRNAPCFLTESLDRCAEVIILDKKNNILVHAYISCILGRPYEVSVDLHKVADIAEKLCLLVGCHEISLGSTIEAGKP